MCIRDSSWTILILPFLLALVSITATAAIMIAYLLMWFIRAIVLNVRVVQSYKLLEQHQKIHWQALIDLSLIHISEPTRPY